MSGPAQSCDSVRVRDQIEFRTLPGPLYTSPQVGDSSTPECTICVECSIQWRPSALGSAPPAQLYLIDLSRCCISSIGSHSRYFSLANIFQLSLIHFHGPPWHLSFYFPCYEQEILHGFIDLKLSVFHPIFKKKKLFLSLPITFHK